MDFLQAAETEELQRLHDQLTEKNETIRHLREVLNLRKQHVEGEEVKNDDQIDTSQTATADGAEQSEEVQQVPSDINSGAALASLSLGRDISFSWHRLKDSPSGLSRGCTAIDGNKAYFNDGSAIIYCYKLQQDSWVEMPTCPRVKFGMVAIDGRLTLVGGHQYGLKGTLLRLGEEWTEEFPSMRIPRESPAVAYSCTNKLLVAAGGKEQIKGAVVKTRSVEVLDTDTKCWSLISEPLPHQIENMSCTICADSLYILGDEGRMWSSRMIACPLSKLKAQTSEPHLLQATPLSHSHTWDVITSPPTYSSTCTSVRDELLAVGGHSGYQWQPKSEVYRFDRQSNSWEVIGYLPTPRFSTSVACLPGNRLVIVGGYTGLFSMSSTLVEMLQL